MTGIYYLENTYQKNILNENYFQKFKFNENINKEYYIVENNTQEFKNQKTNYISIYYIGK